MQAAGIAPAAGNGGKIPMPPRYYETSLTAAQLRALRPAPGPAALPTPKPQCLAIARLRLGRPAEVTQHIA